MQQLKRRLHKGGSNLSRPIIIENIASYETTIAAGERVAIAVSKQRIQHNFVAKLLQVISSKKGRDSFAAKNTTWLLTLHFAIINSYKSADRINIEI
ncbi:hypothetical protein RB213_011938 [Colletotrichum asianum]